MHEARRYARKGVRKASGGDGENSKTGMKYTIS